MYQMEDLSFYEYLKILSYLKENTPCSLYRDEVIVAI